MSGEIEEIKMRKKFIAAILFPIDSSPLKLASVNFLFLSAHILFGTLLEHRLLSRGSFVTLLIWIHRLNQNYNDFKQRLLLPVPSVNWT